MNSVNSSATVSAMNAAATSTKNPITDKVLFAVDSDSKGYGVATITLNTTQTSITPLTMTLSVN